MRKALKTMENKHADKKQLARGVDIEAEHDGRRGKGTDVVRGNPINQAKIAMAHLNEDPKYYSHLKEMEDKYGE